MTQAMQNTCPPPIALHFDGVTDPRAMQALGERAGRMYSNAWSRLVGCFISDFSKDEIDTARALFERLRCRSERYYTAKSLGLETEAAALARENVRTLAAFVALVEVICGRKEPPSDKFPGLSKTELDGFLEHLKADVIEEKRVVRNPETGRPEGVITKRTTAHEVMRHG